MSGTALVGDEAEEEYDVPEEMEDVIGAFCAALSDRHDEFGDKIFVP